MCGIGGWIGDVAGGTELAEAMLRHLRHRGPDGAASRSWPFGTLVHTRLRVIDCSPAGDQPMPNEDGSVWVVFNGEIYNHRELRRWLEERGHRFVGRADTEVVPHLYEELGDEAVTRLRGMFAVAVFDLRRRRLVLARDRLGVKPLFVAETGGGLAFASEIAALRAVPEVDTRVDPQAVADFCALCFVPAPLTWFRGIRAVEPGELLLADLGSGRLEIERRFYHEWRIAPDSSLTLEAAAEQVDAALRAAVSSQLESDVPLGALLSGGIDSSLVVAEAMSSLGSAGLSTYNVAFPDAVYDESWAARAVAEHLGTRHEELRLEDGGGDWELVCALLRHAGQPFADSSIFAVDAIARVMRERVTVALSGDGGDEGFGGYASFLRVVPAAALEVWPRPLRDLLARATAVGGRLGVMSAGAVEAIAALRDGDDVALLTAFHSWVRGEELGRLVAPLGRVEPVRRWFERRWSVDRSAVSTGIERISSLLTEVSARLMLPNDYLFKVDCASMRHALEVRVPMLDEELVALGLRLPHRLKVAGGSTKVLLRHLAARYLPKRVAEKPKAGFSVPVDSWVASGFRNRLRERFLTGHSPCEDLMSEKVFRPWVEAFLAGYPLRGISRAGLYQRIVMLLAADLALE